MTHNDPPLEHDSLQPGYDTTKLTGYHVNLETKSEQKREKCRRKSEREREKEM
jgi:hypothetical protein